jgi:hypothetical protein
VCCCFSAHLEVGGGRRWPQGSHQELGLSLFSSLISLLNTLNAIFTRSPCGIGGPSSACLSFFSNIREALGNKMRIENNYFILGRWA